MDKYIAYQRPVPVASPVQQAQRASENNSSQEVSVPAREAPTGSESVIEEYRVPSVQQSTNISSERHPLSGLTPEEDYVPVPTVKIASSSSLLTEQDAPTYPSIVPGHSTAPKLVSRTFTEPTAIVDVGNRHAGFSSRGQGNTQLSTVEASSNHALSSPTVADSINILSTERPAGTHNGGTESFLADERFISQVSQPDNILASSRSIRSASHSPHGSIVLCMIDSSGAMIPLDMSTGDSSHTPQYPSPPALLSRRGSPVSSPQTTDGQFTFQQRLSTIQEQSISQNSASLFETFQPAVAESPAIQSAGDQPIQHIFLPTLVPSVPGPSTWLRSEENLPAVPPKSPTTSALADTMHKSSSTPLSILSRREHNYSGSGRYSSRPGDTTMRASTSEPPSQRTLSFNDPLPIPHTRKPTTSGISSYNSGSSLTANGTLAGPYPPAHALTPPWDDSDYYLEGSHHTKHLGTKGRGYRPPVRQNRHSDIDIGNPNDREDGGRSERNNRRLDLNTGVLNNPEDVDGGCGLWYWFRGRPQRKKQASEVAGALGIQERTKTITERLAPTLIHAEEALRKARSEARITGWSLNIAIALQVLLAALTTGIAAAFGGRRITIPISILGGLSTIAASYLAKARGSGEPEASALRCSELENFVRELQNLSVDMGARKGSEHDALVQSFRDRFEKIMGSHAGGLMGEFVRERMADTRRHLEDQLRRSEPIMLTCAGSVVGRAEGREGEGEEGERDQQQQHGPVENQQPERKIDKGKEPQRPQV